MCFQIKNRPIDVEFVRLLHDLYASAMINHPYRGYAIIDTEMSNEAIQEIKYYLDTKPICFVFSGIGSQWLGMGMFFFCFCALENKMTTRLIKLKICIGQALLEFPVFCKTVEKCDTILRTHGINVIDILINKTNEAVFDNILNSLVGITVMQVMRQIITVASIFFFFCTCCLFRFANSFIFLIKLFERASFEITSKGAYTEMCLFSFRLD